VARDTLSISQPVLDHLRRQRSPRVLAQQVPDLAPRQTVQRQAGLVGHGRPRGPEFGSEGEQGESSIVRAFCDELSEELQGRRVDPVQVFNH